MPRGAWKGEKILTVCNYLTSTVKSDIRIARVLSEWETTNGGGMCPGISLLILLLIYNDMHIYPIVHIHTIVHISLLLYII